MLQLTDKELPLISGAIGQLYSYQTIWNHCGSNHETCVISISEAEQTKCNQCLDPFDTATKTVATCTCFDFSNITSPIIVVRTIDACWDFCCKTHDDYKR